jgi:hypothetical protein
MPWPLLNMLPHQPRNSCSIKFPPIEGSSLEPLSFSGVAIGSLWSFSSSHYWFDFAPTVAGVMPYGQIIKAE